jgi:hypothetical protein
MKSKQLFVSFLRWTIFIFVLLMAANKIEHKVTAAVGSYLSPTYAQWIVDLHTSANAVRTKDPEGWHYVTTRVAFSVFAVYGIAAAIIAGFVVWWRRDSRDMPDTALETMSTAPSALSH